MIKYGHSWSSVIRNHVKHLKRAVEPLDACANFKSLGPNKTCCWSHRSNDSRDAKDRAAKGQIEVTAVRASKLLLHSGKLHTTSAFQGCMRCEMLQWSGGQLALHSMCRQWLEIETALLPEEKSRHVWFCKIARFVWNVSENGCTESCKHPLSPHEILVPSNSKRSTVQNSQTIQQPPPKPSWCGSGCSQIDHLWGYKPVETENNA